MEKIECPVCSKEFPLLVIEEHVSRCLFLSEPSQVLQESHGVQKRPASNEKNNSPVLKKSKSEYKKCGNLQNKFSSSNPSNSENNVEEISINMNVSKIMILII